MLYTVKMLTGFLTGTGKRSKAVTHCLRVTKDGKKLLFTPCIEAERLGSKKRLKNHFWSLPDKNGKHFLARNHRKGEQKSLKELSSKLSLVAGNVTGGGGKATTTKTYRHGVSRETRVICESRLCADRKLTRRERFRNTKKGDE